MEEKKLNKGKFIGRILFSIVFLVLFLIFLVLVLYNLGIEGITQEEIQKYLEGKGALAPILFIIITFLQVTIIPIPSTITVLVGHYLFGFWLSYFYSFIGMMLGSILAFYLGRWFGRRFINWLVADKDVVDKYLLKIQKKGNVLLFFMFLFPFFPDDLLCSVAGILPISSPSFILMQLFTRAITILTTLFMLSGDIIPFTGWGIPFNICLCLIFAMIFYITYVYAEKISDIFSNIIKRMKKNKK